MHKKFATIFTFMRRTQECHATCLRIELHNFFVHQTVGEEMFFQEQERVIIFLIKLLLDRVAHELFGVK
jgi:hypothetical protein